jgi:hypothetical protein
VPSAEAQRRAMQRSATGANEHNARCLGRFRETGRTITAAAAKNHGRIIPTNARRNATRGDTNTREGRTSQGRTNHPNGSGRKRPNPANDARNAFCQSRDSV